MDIGGLAGAAFGGASGLVVGYAAGCIGYARVKMKLRQAGVDVANEREVNEKLRGRLQKLASFIADQRATIEALNDEVHAYVRLLNKREPVRDASGRFTSKVQA